MEANIVTWNETDKHYSVTLNESKLEARMTNNGSVRATKGQSIGKFYWEIEILAIDGIKSGGPTIGVGSLEAKTGSGSSNDMENRRYCWNGTVIPGEKEYGSAFIAGDVISVLLNMDAGIIEFWINGTSQGVAYTDLKELGEVYPMIGNWSMSSKSTLLANFGSTPFLYQMPEGYSSYSFQELYLIQDGLEIKGLIENNWSVIGSAPATKQMFIDGGVYSFDNIPQPKWKPSMNLLSWTNSNIERAASISIPDSLYDTFKRSYKGIGIIETELEELPAGRKQLMLNADYEGASFEYSLNGGETWYTAVTEEMMDITNQEGNSLKVRVTLPETSSTITALSYAWL